MLARAGEESFELRKQRGEAIASARYTDAAFTAMLACLAMALEKCPEASPTVKRYQCSDDCGKEGPYTSTALLKRVEPVLSFYRRMAWRNK